MNGPIPAWFPSVYCRRAGKPETNLSGIKDSVGTVVLGLEFDSVLQYERNCSGVSAERRQSMKIEECGFLPKAATVRNRT
jgi:hypothetical protein